jgi:serine/threonine-protein kinase
MGAVWAARESDGLGRRVALKTVLTMKRGSEKLAELFVEEARISRAVRHPNLVELYEAGQDQGVPYLAMEWIDGVTLRDLAETPGKLPLGVTLRICMEACDGLHAVHEARTDEGAPLHIVHRDVSPHNLMVSTRGEVKVIDFGIAKARGRMSNETTDGVLRGKIRYMAPEHARGMDIDRRADIWSLGVTVLEVVTGTTPFSAEHDVAALVKLLSQEPEIPRDASLPEPVRAIVERALRRDREERYPDARSMGTALEQAIAVLGAKAGKRDLAEHVKNRRAQSAARFVKRIVPVLRDEDAEREDEAATALFRPSDISSLLATAEDPDDIEPPPPSSVPTLTAPPQTVAPSLVRKETLTRPPMASEDDLTMLRPAEHGKPPGSPDTPETPVVASSELPKAPKVATFTDLPNDGAKIVPPEDDSDIRPVLAGVASLLESGPSLGASVISAPIERREPESSPLLKAADLAPVIPSSTHANVRVPTPAPMPVTGAIPVGGGSSGLRIPTAIEPHAPTIPDLEGASRAAFSGSSGGPLLLTPTPHGELRPPTPGPWPTASVTVPTGGAMPVSAPPARLAPTTPSDDFPAPKRRRWPLVVLGLAIAAGIAVYIYRLPRDARGVPVFAWTQGEATSNTATSTSAVLSPSAVSPGSGPGPGSTASAPEAVALSASRGQPSASSSASPAPSASAAPSATPGKKPPKGQKPKK